MSLTPKKLGEVGLLLAGGLMVAVAGLLWASGTSGMGQPWWEPPPETYSFLFEVHFSPRGGATDAVVRAVAGARTSVRVQAYTFTSEPIAAALRTARVGRGVDVRVIVDKSQQTEPGSKAKALVIAGVPVLVDAAHSIAHNKVIVIDGRTVVTGSFNFSNQAECCNAENVLVIQDRALAARYLENWNSHAAHSTALLTRLDEAPNERRAVDLLKHQACLPALLHRELALDRDDPRIAVMLCVDLKHPGAPQLQHAKPLSALSHPTIYRVTSYGIPGSPLGAAA